MKHNKILYAALAGAGTRPTGPVLPAACEFPAVLGGTGSNAGQMLPPAGIGGPDATLVSDSFHAALVAWRSNCTAALRYNASIYELPALRWTQSSYIQPQIHP